MMSERILVVDDEERIIDLAQMYIEQEGYTVESATDGQVALDMILSDEPALIVLDLMLPSIDGLEICRRVRSQSDVPIIMLTARNDDIDKIVGLELGADDYLTKPYAFSELLARLEVLYRRASAPASGSQITLEVGDLKMDLLTQEVSRAGVAIVLQPREYKLLEYLMRHGGQVVTRAMLLEHVWGYHFDPQTNVVETHVSRLRAKVDKPFGRDLIQTVRGAGYRITE